MLNTPSAVQGDRQVPGVPVPEGAGEVGPLLPPTGKRTGGYCIRTAALDYHVPYVTTSVALRAAVAAIRAVWSGKLPVGALVEITEHGLEA